MSQKEVIVLPDSENEEEVPNTPNKVACAPINIVNATSGSPGEEEEPQHTTPYALWQNLKQIDYELAEAKSQGEGQEAFGLAIESTHCLQQAFDFEKKAFFSVLNNQVEDKQEEDA